MSLSNPTVAIVGATGAVGGELIACLENRNFPLARLRLFAAGRTAGRAVLFRGEGVTVEERTEDSFPGIDITTCGASAGVGGAKVGGFCCPVPPEPRLSLMQRQRAPLCCHWHL